LIIPDPEFKLVRVNYKGISFWEKFKAVKDNPPNLQLTKDYRIGYSYKYNLVQPKDFITDLASVPRLLWAVPGFSPSGPLAYGAIPHDFGYQYGYLLTERIPGVVFNESSMSLYEKFPDKFGELMPVFVGYGKEFFDGLLRDIVIEATGATIIANSTKLALDKFGHTVWNKYRAVGPSVYNFNSLMLPGLLNNGKLGF